LHLAATTTNIEGPPGASVSGWCITVAASTAAAAAASFGLLARPKTRRVTSPPLDVTLVAIFLVPSGRRIAAAFFLRARDQGVGCVAAPDNADLWNGFFRPAAGAL